MRLDPLRRAALLGRRRYRAVFLVALVLVGLALWSASRLRFDTDVLNLLPRDEPVVDTFRAALDEFGSLDFLLVVVRIPEGVVVDPYLAYADRLGRRLAELDSLERVEYRIGELDELVATFFPQAAFFLDPAGRAAVAERLSEEALEARALELRRQLSTPQSLALKSLIRLDPAGLSRVFLDRLESARAGLDVDWTSGYFLSRDQRMLLLLARPVRPPQDVDFARELVATVEAEIAAVDARWGELAGGRESTPAPRVQLAGRYPIALADEATIRNDVIVNVVTSMAGVLLLFLFAFRRFGPLAYAFVPLSCGLALTFGFSGLAFGRLSAATSGVAALLIGLGIDFVIVSYGRFVEERQRGSDLEEALAAMHGSSGRAVVLGGVTSAATFYAFAVTDFTGLRQMGFLTGTGILLCMLAVLALLPAMLSWHEDRHRRRERIPRLFLHGFGSARLIRWSLHHPRAVLAAGALVTVAAAFLASGVRFEDSVQAMRPPDSRTVALRDEIQQRFGSGFDAMMLVIRADDEEELLTLVGRAAAGARELVASGELTGYDAVTSIIPPPERQDEVLAWLEEGRASGRLDAGQVRRRFEAALTAAGLRPSGFDRGLDLLAETLSPSRRLQLESFGASPTGRALLERYVHRDGDGWKSVVYLYPPPGEWRREPPPGAVALADELGPGAVLTGANVVSELMRRTVLRDAWIAGIVGFVLVAILLWFDFRRVEDTLLTLAPLVVGILWMVGGMVLAGIPMNFMNIFVSTMIIGIGVDYGIHMMHRFRETERRSDARFEAGLAETGKAIVMAALSTVVGFGSLSLSHYPGLQSMGKVAILGALATCVVAITLLPAWLAWSRAGRSEPSARRLIP